MNTKQNLHIHSVYCDGKDTPEEMVEQGILFGYGSLGFSGHSPRTASSVAMSHDRLEAYKKEILRLKELYRGRMDIYLGIEYDSFSVLPREGYEYIIGSVHCLDTWDGPQPFDKDLESTLRYVEKYFEGDGMKFAKAYYEEISHMPDKGHCDIIGHFDIVTKNNELFRFIDVDSKEYKKYAFEAIHALKGRIPYFEVNTGAVARGYRTSPYPEMELLKEFRKCGFGAMISTDCHDKNILDCFYEESRELLREAGFSSRFILTDDGFREVEI